MLYNRKKIISYFIQFPVAVNIFILAFFAFGTAGVLSIKSSFFPLNESCTDMWFIVSVLAVIRTVANVVSHKESGIIITHH